MNIENPPRKKLPEGGPTGDSKLVLSNTFGRNITPEILGEIEEILSESNKGITQEMLEKIGSITSTQGKETVSGDGSEIKGEVSLATNPEIDSLNSRLLGGTKKQVQSVITSGILGEVIGPQDSKQIAEIANSVSSEKDGIPSSKKSRRDERLANPNRLIQPQDQAYVDSIYTASTFNSSASFSVETQSEKKKNLANLLAKVAKIEAMTKNTLEKGSAFVLRKRTQGEVDKTTRIQESDSKEAVEKENSVYDRREERAQKFAEKYGISGQRDAMLQSEAAYEQEIRRLKGASIRLPWKKISKQVQERYDNSRRLWAETLRAYTSTIENPREKAEAKIISFRDTVMRAEEARIQATLEGSSEHNKKFFNKAIAWTSRVPKGMLSMFTKGTNTLGTGLATVHAKGFKAFGKETTDMEKLVERYRRASRIMSGAALGSLLAPALTGSLGAAALGTFVFKAARGTVGFTLGTIAGHKAGSLYEKTIGESLRANLRNAKRSSSMSLDESVRALRLGTGESIAGQKRLIEVLTAVLAGGATSLSVNELHNLSSHISTLPAVEHANKILSVPFDNDEIVPTQADIPASIIEQTDSNSTVGSMPFESNLDMTAPGEPENILPSVRTDVSVDTGVPAKPPENMIPRTAPPADVQGRGGMPLPEGIDPNSHEATEYYNRVYNKSVFPQTGVSAGTTEAPHINASGSYDDSVKPGHVDTVPSVEQQPETTGTPRTAPLEAPIEPLESFTNSHGVTIDSKVPHAYEQVDTDAKKFLSMHGGTDTERMSAAQSFLKVNPGATITLQVPETNIITGEKIYRPFEISSDSSGKLLIPSTSIENEVLTHSVEPKNFIKTIDFIYKKP
jgi:hypothetical protein